MIYSTRSHSPTRQLINLSPNCIQREQPFLAHSSVDTGLPYHLDQIILALTHQLAYRDDIAFEASDNSRIIRQPQISLLPLPATLPITLSLLALPRQSESTLPSFQGCPLSEHPRAAIFLRSA